MAAKKNASSKTKTTTQQPTIKLGILGAGEPPEPLNKRYPKYNKLIGDQLKAIDKRIQPVLYNLWDGEMPESINECDAWLITGSKHSAYEELPWIVALREFVQEVYDKHITLVGICFGHQLIAHALGGVVEPSERGWGLGLHQYTIVNPPPWLAEAPKHFRIQSFHQDQITALPPSGQVIGESDFCPVAALVYGNSRTLSFQGHPEFNAQYVRALLDQRDQNHPNDPTVQAAYSSIDGPHDRESVMKWIADFIVREASNSIETAK